jgi:hypothetical protein
MAKRNFRFGSIPEYLAGSRMHSEATTLGRRDDVFHASMRLLKRHYGYVPFSWVFGYAAYRMDRRDQFFQPLEPSLLKYLASLPMGLRWNPAKPFRFLGEWLCAPVAFFKRRG